MAESATQAKRLPPPETSPSGPARLWSARKVGAIIGVVVLALLIVFGIPLLDRRGYESVTLAGPISRIDVQLVRGNVALVAAESDTRDAVVERSSYWRLTQPEIIQEVDSSTGVARIRTHCPRLSVLLGSCSVDYVIEVPNDVRVNVRTDSGSVTATGIEGRLRVVTSGGDVVGTGLLSREVLVDSVNGDLSLSFAAPPTRVEAVTGSGSVDIEVPGGPYAVTSDSDDRDLVVQVPTDSQADRSIRASSGKGGITITPP